MQLELAVTSAPAAGLGRPACRSLGAYYTRPDAARAMAAWGLRSGSETVMEPSFGEGVFLRALFALISDRAWSGVAVHGVEIDPRAFQRTTSALPTLLAGAHCTDFLRLDPFPVDAVIGNPPYVRLRHMPRAQAARALRLAASVLGQPMEPAGSLWMPFVLHALRFLRSGGRLALVLPHEATYVRYARPLWPVLARSFGSLRVVRVRGRMFPSILQGVVLLFADHYGQRTNVVQYDAYETVAQFLTDQHESTATIEIASIANGERPFIEALLPAELRLLLPGLRRLTVEARDHVNFHIGYVAGDKRYFHPGSDVIQSFQIPPSVLVPSLTSARRISRQGLLTSAFQTGAVSRLFLARSTQKLSRGERKYVEHGSRLAINSRYKCRVRTPWYVVPDVRIPDLVLPTFSERPLLLVNDGGLAASNSFLCGYIHSGVPALCLAASWYTSLTLLETEMQVHALGGGVLVFVPREAGRIRIVRPVAHRTHVDEVARALRGADGDAAFHAGDTAILMKGHGLRSADVELVREGIRRLRLWRTSATPHAVAR